MRVLERERERERDLEAIVGVVVNEEVSVVVADLEFPSNHFLFLCVCVEFDRVWTARKRRGKRICFLFFI